MASEIAAGMRRAAREMHGIVVSAGFMDKTVKVRLGGQRWEPRVHKVRLSVSDLSIVDIHSLARIEGASQSDLIGTSHTHHTQPAPKPAD